MADRTDPADVTRGGGVSPRSSERRTRLTGDLPAEEVFAAVYPGGDLRRKVLVEITEAGQALLDQALPSVVRRR